MTIDEAIAREREKAKEIRENIIDKNNLEPYESYCIAMTARCAEEHEQLVMWLEELKVLKENSISKEAFEKMKSKSYQYGYRKGHGDAINKVLKLPKYTIYDTSNEFMNIRIDAISIEDILKLKEQNK